MVKEYKVIAAPHIEDVIKAINEGEYKEWDILATLQEHAYTKIILQKDTGDNPLGNDGLDTLSGLIKLLSDEKKTLKLISDLKTAYTSHTDGLDKLLDLRDDLGKKQIDLQTQEAFITSAKAGLDADKAATEKLKAQYKASVEDLELQKKLASDKTKAEAQALQAAKADHEKEKKAHLDHIQAMTDSVLHAQAELSKKIEATNLREASLSKKEAEHNEIKKQASEFANFLRK